MKQPLNLRGQVFGRLTVLYRVAGKPGVRWAWACWCECGKRHVATTNNLRRGYVTSCGCRRAETLKDNRRSRWQNQVRGPKGYFTSELKAS